MLPGDVAWKFETKSNTCFYQRMVVTTKSRILVFQGLWRVWVLHTFVIHDSWQDPSAPFLHPAGAGHPARTRWISRKGPSGHYYLGDEHEGANLPTTDKVSWRSGRARLATHETREKRRETRLARPNAGPTKHRFGPPRRDLPSKMRHPQWHLGDTSGGKSITFCQDPHGVDTP